MQLYHFGGIARYYIFDAEGGGRYSDANKLKLRISPKIQCYTIKTVLVWATRGYYW